MSGYTVVKLNKTNGETDRIYFSIHKNEAFNYMKIQRELLTLEEKHNTILEVWKSCGEVTEVIASYFTRECYIG